jgi:hypothetical protein
MKSPSTEPVIPGYVTVTFQLETSIQERLEKLAEAISKIVSPSEPWEGRYRSAAIASTVNLALTEGLDSVESEIARALRPG